MLYTPDQQYLTSISHMFQTVSVMGKKIYIKERWQFISLSNMFLIFLYKFVITLSLRANINKCQPSSGYLLSISEYSEMHM